MIILIIFFILCGLLFFCYKIPVTIWFESDILDFKYKVKIWLKEFKGEYQLTKKKNEKHELEKDKSKKKFSILKIKKILQYIEWENTSILVQIGLLFPAPTILAVTGFSTFLPMLYQYINGGDRIFSLSSLSCI